MFSLFSLLVAVARHLRAALPLRRPLQRGAPGGSAATALDGEFSGMAWDGLRMRHFGCMNIRFFSKRNGFIL